MSILDDVDEQQLIYTIENAFDEFNAAVNGNKVRIDGIYIVGSVLTGEFTPHQSDLDLYAQVSTSYEYNEGFRRLLSDPTEQWHVALNQSIPSGVTKVDFLGFVTSSSEIREPSKFVKIR